MYLWPVMSLPEEVQAIVCHPTYLECANNKQNNIMIIRKIQHAAMQQKLKRNVTNVYVRRQPFDRVDMEALPADFLMADRWRLTC
jgi:hypothetical protein